MNLEGLSNEELLSGLHRLLGQGRIVLARLLAYLGEVEERRLDLESACSSLFDYCVRRLGMGEDEACRRVAAARIVRRYPIALGMIERGEIHLTALLLLRAHLTDENHEELLGAAKNASKSEVQHLLAARFPRADAPSLIQPLPAAPTLSPRAETTPASTATARIPSSGAARMEPLSTERYKVQFTASAALRDKIERAANLMRHKNPSGDLSVVVDRAVDLLLAELEKQRLGKTTRASAKTPRKRTRRGYVPRAVRREVFERDGEQCTFVDEAGRRCASRAFLELDHLNPRALGGADDATNLAVRCRAHNGLGAERDFGREHIEKKKNERRSNTEAPVDPVRSPRKVVKTDEKESYPLQRGYATALRGLRGMGFKDGEARRAVGIVEERRAGSDLPIETILREVLSALV